MSLTAEQKEEIMAARNSAGRVISGNMSWQVTLAGSKPFTFITEQCNTPDEVEAAMYEKFNKETLGLKLL